MKFKHEDSTIVVDQVEHNGNAVTIYNTFIDTIIECARKNRP